jgi:hypothetical protein
MKSYRKQYRDLEMTLMRELRELVENSNYTSTHTNQKAIQVDVFDYTELTLIDDRLLFLDSRGTHYSLFSDCTIDDLIDILEIFES